MKKILTFLSRHAAVVLPALAVFFATSPCVGKIYEPKLPKQLEK